MPIVVHAVTPQQFTAWLVEAKTKFSDASPLSPQPGTAQPAKRQAILAAPYAGAIRTAAR
jgi:heme/copper-type cytochrome/quinol oxidase subunit 2